MKILSIVGARPNFMKIAPFIQAISAYNQTIPIKTRIRHILVHTGQHYDDRMSKKFFEELNIPGADINLGIGSGTHAEQVGYTMIELEKVIRHEKPNWIVVCGDVNATLAASVTGKKEWVKVCHIEAGLRSGDSQMPEEINRLVTDRLSDLLLTPDRLSGQNLLNEGIPDYKIKFVGNIMIDTLEANYYKAAKLKIADIINSNLLEDLSEDLTNKHQRSIPKKIWQDVELLISKSEKSHLNFAILTMHRPSNVDRRDILEPIINFICDEITQDMALLWPIHPRTQKRLQEFGLWEKVSSTKNLILLHPIGYHEMLRLNMDATIMLTDSGGLQEECTVLGTPCLTLRWNTERPITLHENGGASILVGNDLNRIREEYQKRRKFPRKPVRPELWDGQTAGRCLRAILEFNYNVGN